MVCMWEREVSLAWLLDIRSENIFSKLPFREVRAPKLSRKADVLCSIHVLVAAKPVLGVFLGSVFLLGTYTLITVWGNGSPYVERSVDAETYKCIRIFCSEPGLEWACEFSSGHSMDVYRGYLFWFNFIQKKASLYTLSFGATNVNHEEISGDNWGSQKQLPDLN